MSANLAGVAALIGEPGRAAMLQALVGGEALPAGELAAIAGFSAQAASSHLAKLVEGELLAVEQQGRHRYYRLASAEVAAALESLAALAGPAPPSRAISQSAEAERFRHARSCYGHLAGELGVQLAMALEARGVVADAGDKRLEITPSGRVWLVETLDLDVERLKPGRHGLACRCLDWTERRHHVAGPLGTALLSRLAELGWLERPIGSREVRVTMIGRAKLPVVLGAEPVEA